MYVPLFLSGCGELDTCDAFKVFRRIQGSTYLKKKINIQSEMQIHICTYIQMKIYKFIRGNVMHLR